MRCPAPMTLKITRRLRINACRKAPRRPGRIFFPQHQSASFFHSETPPQVSRRGRDVSRLCTTGTTSNFGPLLRARMGARARSLKTNRNRPIFVAGAKERPGTLIRRCRIPLLRIRRYASRYAVISRTEVSRAAVGVSVSAVGFFAHEPSASLPERAPRRQRLVPYIG